MSGPVPVSTGWGVLTWWGGWLPAFVLTCIIELAVYLVMLELFGLVGREAGQQARGQLTRGRAVLVVLGVNLVTHPIFWAVALGLRAGPAVLVGELVVTAVEAALLWVVIRRRPLACLASSAVANAASAVLGGWLLGALLGALIGAAS